MLLRTLALAGVLFAGGLLAACTGEPVATATPVPTAVSCKETDPHAAGLFAVVLDPDGSPIKGAIVEIHRAEFTGNATTSADGRFQAACTSGHFSISVSAIGHNPATKEIDVALGQRVETTITLPRVPTASG
jgi:hypothetical protein